METTAEVTTSTIDSVEPLPEMNDPAAPIVDSELIEEISIDGMCGVY